MRYLKIFGYEWLEGSIRRDLDSAGRGVWADILSLASISRRIGFVERSEGIPYTEKELAEKFQIDIKLLQNVINTCIIEGRLAREPEHMTLYITNWDRYQEYPLGSSVDLQKGKGKREKPEQEAPGEGKFGHMVRSDDTLISGQSVEKAIKIAQGQLEASPRNKKTYQEELDRRGIEWRQGGYKLTLKGQQKYEANMLARWEKEYQKAKTAGDEKRMAELESYVEMVTPDEVKQ